MSKLQQLYALKRDGQTVKTGSVEDLAAYSGLTVNTIYSYASTTKRNRWEVVQIDPFLPHEAVDTRQIKTYLNEQDLTAAVVADALGISRSSVNVKLSGKTRFKESELKTLADTLGVKTQDLMRKGEWHDNKTHH